MEKVNYVRTITVKNKDSLLFTYQCNNYYGASQLFYRDRWAQKAGCGATSATNMIMYLARNNAYFAKLFRQEINHDTVLGLMKRIYTYIMPTMLGVNRINIMIKGLTRLAADNNLPFIINSLAVKITAKPSLTTLENYLIGNLSRNCPICFLNLDRGKVENIDSWHWILIYGVAYDDHNLLAYAFDNGGIKKFDIKLWLASTKLNGGFVAIRQP